MRIPCPISPDRWNLLVRWGTCDEESHWSRKKSTMFYASTLLKHTIVLQPLPELDVRDKIDLSASLHEKARNGFSLKTS